MPENPSMNRAYDTQEPVMKKGVEYENVYTNVDVNGLGIKRLPE